MLVAIVLYIAWVFRKVSKPVASWKYGIAAIIALFHDVIITMGIFAVLGEARDDVSVVMLHPHHPRRRTAGKTEGASSSR